VVTGKLRIVRHQDVNEIPASDHGPANAAAGAGLMSIPSVFANVVRGHADKIAVEYADERASYRDLQALARAISDRLPGPERTSLKTRVALLFDDRIRALGATLAALGAGHAFVPLDAADPEDRIEFILKDSEPVALLTDREHFARARQLVPPGCLLIDIQEPAADRRPKERAEVGPDDLAYIFYTSGSTGQPKGVCQTHRNLLHFVGCYSRMLGIGEADRLSLLYSLSFSAANMDIFGGLLNGATVCAYDMRQRGLPGLANWLDEREVTVLHAVPTIFRKLAAGLEAERKLERIRAIDLGGEAVSPRDVELYRAHFRADCLLVNHLAATEPSVIAQHAIDPDRTYGTGMLPVGLCPDGVSVRIERPDGSEAAADEVGRIVVASPYVSPGYWRRPELTAAAFCDDPARPGWRNFRTEDVGCIGPDRELYFHGRQGPRVKIRGQSVDLAEVEAAVRRCAGVQDVGVVAGSRENGPEADLLVAHVVMAKPAGDEAKALRRQLSAYLPQYMIPSAFAFPDALPMTSTGKIDRRALQLRRIPDAPSEDDRPKPADPLEERIAGIFATILDRATVGRGDDFYLLGGDSLSSVELQASLSEMMGQDVALKDILADSTVSGLASALRQMDPPSKASALSNSLVVPLQTHGSWPPLFLVHGKLGQAHVGPQFLQLLGEDQPVYAIEARGLHGADRPNASVAAMAEDYVAAISAVQPKGPYFLVGLCVGGYVAMEMARMLREQAHEVLPLLLVDPPPPPFARTSAAQEAPADPVAARLHHRRFQGRANMTAQDPMRLRAAARRFRVTFAFERALAELTPRPYEGEAYILTNAQRLGPSGWGDRSKRESFFSGRLHFLESTTKHDLIIDVNDRTFTEHLREYLRHMRERVAHGRSGRSVES
jgi:amino acid adenylation domain-containing protein